MHNSRRGLPQAGRNVDQESVWSARDGWTDGQSCCKSQRVSQNFAASPVAPTAFRGRLRGGVSFNAGLRGVASLLLVRQTLWGQLMEESVGMQNFQARCATAFMVINRPKGKGAEIGKKDRQSGYEADKYTIDKLI